MRGGMNNCEPNGPVRLKIYRIVSEKVGREGKEEEMKGEAGKKYCLPQLNLLGDFYSFHII
jgi:hypothetical protein